MTSRRLRVHVAASRVHKWLALIIGVQLLLWFASGALMSFLPIDKVHGDHLVDRERTRPLAADATYADPAKLVRGAGAPVQSVTFHMRGSRPVAELSTAAGMRVLDARTAAPLPPLDRREAISIASLAWRGSAPPVASAGIVETESPEYRGQLPAWRVEFADGERTRVFVTHSGRIAAVRTSTWRLYDFFWSLHIMDWKNHENFNSPWLLAFAVGGLVLAIAGTVLLVMRWPVQRRRRVRSALQG